jgi:hypothetical protein
VGCCKFFEDILRAKERYVIMWVNGRIRNKHITLITRLWTPSSSLESWFQKFSDLTW